MPYCSACGQEIEPQWNACPNCGHGLPPEPPVRENTPTPTGENRPAPSGESQPRQEPASRSGTTRRRWLRIGGGLVTIALLGGGAWAWLSGPPADHISAGETAWSNRETVTTNGGEAIRGTVTLEVGEYTGYSFETYGSAGLIAGVGSLEGGPIDIWGIKADDLQAYQNGADVPFITEISQPGITGQTEMITPTATGEYYLIVDNTPTYGADPEGEVTAEVVLGAGRL